MTKTQTLAAVALLTGAIATNARAEVVIQESPNGTREVTYCAIGVREQGCRPEAYILCKKLGDIFRF